MLGGGYLAPAIGARSEMVGYVSLQYGKTWIAKDTRNHMNVPNNLYVGIKQDAKIALLSARLSCLYFITDVTVLIDSRPAEAQLL